MNFAELRHNRYLRVLFVPFRTRALVRGSEIGIVIAGALIGILSGLAVAAIGGISQWMHQAIFGLQQGERLSAAIQLYPSAFIAPMAGGILMGVLIWVLARWRKRPIVDPIEANALHGGRLSLTDSFILVGQNLISNGFGASVGLEAAYTQLASGFASRIGRALKLRRADMRTLVGCGAGGSHRQRLQCAADRLVLCLRAYHRRLFHRHTCPRRGRGHHRDACDAGHRRRTFHYRYRPDRRHHPARLCTGPHARLHFSGHRHSHHAWRYPGGKGRTAQRGAQCAGAGNRRRNRRHDCVFSPQVLASGHGALHLDLNANITIPVLVLLILTKSLASAVFIGSGFRGGLFFASLFLGALTGKLFAAIAGTIMPASLALAPEVYAVIGMSSLCRGCGWRADDHDLPRARNDRRLSDLHAGSGRGRFILADGEKTFGYSFATWRFHLRGEAIRSAHDIGWIRDLTVARMMRHDVRTVAIDTDIETFRHDFPLGSTQRVIAVDSEGRYVGMIPVPEAYGDSFDTADKTHSIAELLKYQDEFLLPQMNAKEAVARFDRAESEALAVIDNAQDRKVLGLLSEAHTLRRYSEELDRRRREVAGEV